MHGMGHDRHSKLAEEEKGSGSLLSFRGLQCLSGVRARLLGLGWWLRVWGLPHVASQVGGRVSSLIAELFSNMLR